jgi:hypothetical protein
MQNYYVKSDKIKRANPNIRLTDTTKQIMISALERDLTK